MWLFSLGGSLEGQDGEYDVRGMASLVLVVRPFFLIGGGEGGGGEEERKRDEMSR